MKVRFLEHAGAVTAANGAPACGQLWARVDNKRYMGGLCRTERPPCRPLVRSPIRRVSRYLRDATSETSSGVVARLRGRRDLALFRLKAPDLRGVARGSLLHYLLCVLARTGRTWRGEH
jgi:hypothetical protein